MKKVMMIAGGVAFAGMITGCATCSRDDLACKHEKLVTTETSVWSYDQISRSIYPEVQGPVETYKPVYKVDTQKFFIKGIGDTKEQALANAIYNMCKAKNCDSMVTAKCYFKKVEDKLNGTTCEAEVVGFPVYITGVEPIKPKCYAEQKDGSLKPTEMEHKIIFTTNNVWRVAAVPGTKGATESANVPAVISRSERKVRMCEIENGVPPPYGDSGKKPVR